MNPFIEFLIPATNFIMLTAVGMDLTADDFRRLRRQPSLVWTGLLAPIVLLPPIAVAVTILFRTPPEYAAGVLLVAACPIGGISNTYSYLARASTALSVTLTGLSGLCAAITIPLIGKALTLVASDALNLSAPLLVLVLQLTAALALPVLLGLVIRRRAPAVVERYQPVMRRVTACGIVAVLGLVIAQDPMGFADGWQSTVPMTAVFVLASMSIGWATASLVSRDPRDRFTFAAEFGCRNLAVAATIAATVLGRVEFARFGVLYFLTEIPILLAAAAVFRTYGDRRVAALTRG